MCGITGFVSNNSVADIEGRAELLGRMCQSIIHRGPDELGTMVRGRAALGMRRLSIIDIRSGQQPIFTDDGELAIVFNGEIYNFRELRVELEAAGHRFHTRSDTEVVLHAFQQYGPDCLQKLRGMFAFAIWNSRDESIFIARDRLGKKPLFYSLLPDGEFVFGSELKTLIVHGKLRKEIDLAALDAYLSFGYVPDEFCILKGVEKLLPGHFLYFQNGSITSEKYWDLELSAPDYSKTENDWADELQDKIREAVRVRLVSEVPLGAFLSGGVDSSAVVAMMSQLSDRPVKTFSIGFQEDSFDELKYARIAARHFSTEHQEFIVTPELFDLVGDIVTQFDEPFADQSSLPTFLLSKMARDHVTVVLSGDGGDELFAGYDRYVTDQKRARYGRLPAFFREHLLRPLSQAMPHGAAGKNFIYNISLDPVYRYIDSISAFNRPRKGNLYSKELVARLNGGDGAGEKLFADFADRPAADNPLDRLLYLDTKTYLPGDILTKVDRMTMANSLEARVPLLDHELVELAAKIPVGLKMKGSETKYIFKKSMEGLIPREILYRKKQGFGVPVSKWLNDQLCDAINDDLSSSQAARRGFFDQTYIKTLLKEHAVGRRDHSGPLWMLWMLELWMRRNIDV